MFIEIVLAIIFIGSIYLFWRAVSAKIPELIAIPDSVIAQRLGEGESFLHHLLLHIVQFRDFYRTRRYQDALKGWIGKFLYRIHILLLRTDNRLVALAKKILKNRAGSHAADRAQKHKGNEYWKQLQQEESLASSPYVTRIRHTKAES